MPRAAIVRSIAYVMKEIAAIGAVTHVIATAVATIVGWATPFANRVETPAMVHAYTVSIVTVTSFIGSLVMCPLIPFLVRRAASSAPPAQSFRVVMKNAWVVLRHSVFTLALSPLVSGALTELLVVVGVPVVQYNAHSLIGCIVVTVAGVSFATNYRRFLRRAHARSPVSSPKCLASVHPQGVVPPSRPPRARRSWSHAVFRAIRISLPMSLTAMVTIQYITIARHTKFDSMHAFLKFSAASSALKMLLPVVVKLYIAKTGIRDARNTFYMVSGPLFHIEIQLRMAMVKAQHAGPLVLTSAFVNLAECAARGLAVSLDLAIVWIARRRLAQRIQGLRTHPTFEERVQALHDAHNGWEQAHLRVSAAEIIAGMAAEYCGIGLTAIFMLVLHDNASIELPPVASAPTTLDLVRRSGASWLTQMGFEVVTDVLATTMEMRVGIPVRETLESDTESFIRWAIAVITAHASGICLTSLIVAS